MTLLGTTLKVDKGIMLNHEIRNVNAKKKTHFYNNAFTVVLFGCCVLDLDHAPTVFRPEAIFYPCAVEKFNFHSLISKN